MCIRDRKYRWKSAVAEKGDNARTHFGIIAQDLQDAFTAEGLDASDYAMFTSNTWWEKEISVDAVDKDGKIIPQGIDQSKLVPLLVKTIQELEARIVALETA